MDNSVHERLQSYWLKTPLIEKLDIIQSRSNEPRQDIVIIPLRISDFMKYIILQNQQTITLEAFLNKPFFNMKNPIIHSTESLAVKIQIGEN